MQEFHEAHSWVIPLGWTILATIVGWWWTVAMYKKGYKAKQLAKKEDKHNLLHEVIEDRLHEMEVDSVRRPEFNQAMARLRVDFRDTTESIRHDFHEANQELKGELTVVNRELKTDLTQANDRLRSEMKENIAASQSIILEKLQRIEDLGK